MNSDFVLRALESSPVATAVVEGPDHRFVYANAAYLALPFVDDSALIGRTVGEIFHRVAKEGRYPPLDEAWARAERAQWREFETRHPERGVQWWNLGADPVRGDDGGMAGFVFTAHDVTAAVEDRARAERLAEEARGSERRLRLALDAAQLGEWDMDVASNTAVRSPIVDRFFGFEPGEVGTAIEPLIARRPAEDSARVAALGLELVRTKAREFVYDYRVVWPDGSVHWLESTCEITYAEDGRPARILGVIANVTERKRAEAALRQSERMFRDLAEALPHLVWTTRPDGHHDYYNRRWYEFVGAAEGETDGEGWSRILHPDDHGRTVEAWRRSLETGEPYQIEYRMKGADGAYHWLLARAMPVRDDEGRILRWFGTCTDIDEIVAARDALRRRRKELTRLVDQRTAELAEANRRLKAEMEERARAEEALRHAQKMEAIGKLTGGVAHDFNNLLQVIGGNLQLLDRDVAGNARASRRVRNALVGVDRGAKLAAQLLAFARRQPLEPKAVNLGRLVRGMGDMLRRALGEAVEIETVIGGGLWNTLVDPAQVENAILNLAVNARDAMAGAGRLTIEAGNAALDDAYAAAHAEVEPGQYVMLAVTDTGGGIPPEILPRVFEPFFTTKGEGHGTGLGLSMVYGFVKQSGGHVKIYSEPGHGTTVRLYLPRVREAEQIQAEPAAGPPVSGGTETVLVVEDDREVRATVVELLGELGYRVLQAEDGQSALAIVKSGIPIDLLFTDVVMPGPLRSPDLARQAQALQPGMAVLFTSGYTENAIVHGGRLDAGVSLLSKPYRKEDLARKVRQLLAQRDGRAAGAA
ncbi:MAG TPA: PAS domain-containing protein [Alphaproteobacteria bacterium]|nr:PAS domain-containing protein [Alphaproteobacteria bacterium]